MLQTQEKPDTTDVKNEMCLSDCERAKAICTDSLSMFIFGIVMSEAFETWIH